MGGALALEGGTRSLFENPFRHPGLAEGETLVPNPEPDEEPLAPDRMASRRGPRGTSAAEGRSAPR